MAVNLLNTTDGAFDGDQKTSCHNKNKSLLKLIRPTFFFKKIQYLFIITPTFSFILFFIFYFPLVFFPTN